METRQKLPRWTLCLLLSTCHILACGGPILDAGWYDVTTIQVEDDCGYRDNDLTHPIWEIDHIDGQYYGIKHPSGDTISGEVEGEAINFSKKEWEIEYDSFTYEPVCRYTIANTLILWPDGGDYFTGDLSYEISADCTENICNMLWVVEGSKKEQQY